MKLNLLVPYRLNVRRKWQRTDESEIFYTLGEFYINEFNSDDLSIAIKANTPFIADSHSESKIEKEITIYNINGELFAPAYPFDKKNKMPVDDIEKSKNFQEEFLKPIDDVVGSIVPTDPEKQKIDNRDTKIHLASFTNREDSYNYNKLIENIRKYFKSFSPYEISIPEVPTRPIYPENIITMIKDDMEKCKDESIAKYQELFNSFCIVDGNMYTKLPFPSLKIVLDDEGDPLFSAFALGHQYEYASIMPLYMNEDIETIFDIQGIKNLEITDIPDEHPSMDISSYVNHLKSNFVRNCDQMRSFMRSYIDEQDVSFFEIYSKLRDQLYQYNNSYGHSDEERLAGIDFDILMETAKKAVSINQRFSEKKRPKYEIKNLSRNSKMLEVIFDKIEQKNTFSI